MSLSKKQATPATSLTDIFKSRISSVKEDLAKTAFNELNKSDTNESPNMIKIDVPPEKEKSTRKKKNKYFLDFIPDISEKLNFNDGKPGAFRLKITDSFGTLLEEFDGTYYGCMLFFDDKSGTNLKISDVAWNTNETNNLYGRNPNHRPINNGPDENVNTDVWSLERIDANFEQQTRLSAAPGPYVLKRTNAEGIINIVTTGTHAACMDAYRKLYHGAQSGYVHSTAQQASEALSSAFPQSDSVYRGQNHQPTNSGYPQGTNRPYWDQSMPFNSSFVDARRFTHGASTMNSRYPTGRNEQVNAFVSKPTTATGLVYVNTELGEINIDLIKEKGDVILALVKIISDQMDDFKRGKKFEDVAPVLKCLYKAFSEVIGACGAEELIANYDEQDYSITYNCICKVAELVSQFKVGPIKVRKQTIHYDEKGFTSKIVVEQYTFD